LDSHGRFWQLPDSSIVAKECIGTTIGDPKTPKLHVIVRFGQID